MLKMKIPQLEKKPELKSCHNVTWEDNYSWIHQNNILEVLKDKNKLDPEVERYLNEENEYTNHHLKDTKDYQKVIELSYSTIVMSIPSFVFFIVLPILLKFKQNFVFSLIVSIISTAIAYAIFMFIIKKFNFNF